MDENREQGVRKKTLPLKKRILVILVSFVAAVGIVVLLSGYQSVAVTERMNTELNTYYTVNAFASHFLAANQALSQYWSAPKPHSEEEELYWHEIRLAQRYLDAIQREPVPIGSERYLWANGLEAVFTSYSGEAATVLAMTIPNKDEAVDHYYNGVVPAAGYVQHYAQKVLEHQLANGQALYRRTQLTGQRLLLLQSGAVLLAAVVGVLLFRVLRRVLTPMQALADASQAITEQDFSQPDLVVERDDEAGRMAEAFNRMKHSMQRSVETLREKNEMAARLHKQERDALEMESLLGQAKLAQLRGQINPHFLFNTLNVISRMAQIEQAPRTKTLVHSLAHLLRYTLETDAEQVPLAREAHIIDEYFAIYKVRFGERVALQWQITPDLELSQVLVPSFILQPLVENAFKHGIGPKIDGGTVHLRVKHKGKWLYISVSDNGVGMDRDQLDAVRRQIGQPQPGGGHIGLYNVAERIRMSGQHSLVRVYSQKNRGTSVVIRLPYQEICIPDDPEEEEA